MWAESGYVRAPFGFHCTGNGLCCRRRTKHCFPSNTFRALLQPRANINVHDCTASSDARHLLQFRSMIRLRLFSNWWETEKVYTPSRVCVCGSGCYASVRTWKRFCFVMSGSCNTHIQCEHSSIYYCLSDFLPLFFHRAIAAWVSSHAIHILVFIFGSGDISYTRFSVTYRLHLFICLLLHLVANTESNILYTKREERWKRSDPLWLIRL